MNKTLITAAALAAMAASPLLAQNAKQSVLTFSLTRQYQVSVSDKSNVANDGDWNSPPIYYKTKTSKLVTADVLHSIAVVLHGNASYYSSSAKLVLVQGELSGFFGVDGLIATNSLLGNLTNYGSGTFDPATFTKALPSTTTAANKVRFATGTHLKPGSTDDGVTFDGAWPPGLSQPWGQIFVYDPTKSPACENVTYFFSITVHQCYDCFYLNSFISDATFKEKVTSGPPCCSGTLAYAGSGKDRYYVDLSFDNTTVNPYLDSANDKYVGVDGLVETEDGVTPDALPYSSTIVVASITDAHDYDIYVMRFTLEGIMTYSWNLKFVNSTDAYPDFVGNASYAVNGFGFVAKVCSLITGTAAIAEKVVKSSTCCTDQPWYDSWYGIGFDPSTDWETVFGVPYHTATDLSYHTADMDIYYPDFTTLK